MSNLYIIVFLILLILLTFYSASIIPTGVDNRNVYYEVQYFIENGFDRGYTTLAPITSIVLYSVIETYNIPLLVVSGISTQVFIVSIYLLIKSLFGHKYPFFLIFLFPIIFERSYYLALTQFSWLYLRVKYEE